MTCLSLRGVIAVVAALSVAIVAAITLSLTLTSSLKALRDIGQDYAGSLLGNAHLSSAEFFDRPQTALTVLQNFTKFSDLPWPSDDPSVVDAFEHYACSLLMANGFVFDTLIIYFRDNTRIQCNSRSDLEGTVRPPRYFGFSVMRASSFTAAGFDQSQQTLSNISTWIRYTSNMSLVTPQTSVYYDQLYTNPNPVKHYHSSLWNNSLLLATGGGIASIYAGIYAAGTDRRGRLDVDNYVTFAAPIYRRSDPVGAQGVFGFVVTAMSFTDFSRFLRRAKSTPNTEAFAVDSLGYLMGSSMGRPFTTTTQVPARTPVRTGCASTSASGGVSLATSVYHLCRTHASAYGHPALAAIIADRAFAYAAAPAVQLLRVDGAVVYAATAPVELRFSGSGVQLLLAMPEEDIIGGVVASRNAAIGVTCGVFVVVAAVMFVLISLLLRPLRGVAEQMRRAANFEEEEDAAVSAMAEVAELQEAAGEMSEELARVRAYVPQSVLAEKAVVSDEDFDLHEDVISSTVDLATPTDATSARTHHSIVSKGSNHSRLSRRLAAAASARAGAASAGGRSSGARRIAELVCELRHSPVAVLVVNLRGFSRMHDVSSMTGNLRAATRSLSTVVGLIESGLAAHGGILASFHGDHFTSTFNAAKPCHTPVMKACQAALDIQKRYAELCDPTVALGLSMGVSVGRCAVGNVGSDTVKGFTTVGPAFSQALVLERLTRMYGPGCSILTTARVCSEIATRLRFRFLDIVKLPGTSRLNLIATILGSIDPIQAGPASPATEWLYVVQSNADNDVHAARNAAFSALARGEGETVARYLLVAPSADADPTSPPPAARTTAAAAADSDSDDSPSPQPTTTSPTTTTSAPVAPADDVRDHFHVLAAQAGISAKPEYSRTLEKQLRDLTGRAADDGDDNADDDGDGDGRHHAFVVTVPHTDFGEFYRVVCTKGTLTGSTASDRPSVVSPR